MNSPRILSIQSHVVSGYCGNKSATFPLQLLELEVDIINSVQLSNHTQYKVTRGQIFESKDLETIHSGLKANNLLALYDHVVSGYVADTSYIRAMQKLLHDIKTIRSALGLPCLYTLDPVLGDDSTSFYVPDGPNIAAAYLDLLIPMADIITPNRFEASILTGTEIDPMSEEAMDQAVLAIERFHQMGIPIVALTSFEMFHLPEQLVCLLSFEPKAASPKVIQAGDCKKNIWKIIIPKLELPFTGTGDLFTALLTGWLCKTNFDFKQSFENTANSIHLVLEDTLDKYKKVENGSVQNFELRLVQNQKALTKPQIRFEAELLTP